MRDYIRAWFSVGRRMRDYIRAWFGGRRTMRDYIRAWFGAGRRMRDYIRARFGGGRAIGDYIQALYGAGLAAIARAYYGVRSAVSAQALIGAGSAAIASLRRRKRAGGRLLIREILMRQLVITAIIGGLAIAGLYWGGQWVLQDSYNRWALQWTEELNELGAPLYLPDDDEVLLRLESFIDKYPEIYRVTY